MKHYDILNLIHDGVNPHTIKLLVDHGYYTTQDWDNAITLAVQYDDMEVRWRESLPTTRERIASFAEEVQNEVIISARQGFVRDEFIRSVQSGETDKKAKARYQALFSTDISDNDIEQASQRPIADFVHTRNGMAKCPFHEERTNSCHITRHLFFCFGCSAAGNTIHFIRKLNGLGFKEAVKLINAQ